jgi:hypothetical protein
MTTGERGKRDGERRRMATKSKAIVMMMRTGEMGRNKL